MAEINPSRVGANYFAGAAAAEDEKLRRKRNALAQMEVESGQRFNALAANPEATATDYARIGRSDVANAMTAQSRFTAEQQQQIAEQLYTISQYALRSGSPKAFLEQNNPDLVKQIGPQWTQLDDNSVRMKLQEFVARYGSQAGIGPPEQIQQQPGPNGSTIVTRGKDFRVVQPQAPQKAPARFRPMNPQEIQTAGLPAGTAAQVNDETGQIQVLSKRDATSNLSQKDATVAKQKLTTINLARQQLQNIQQRFNDIKDGYTAGPLQGRLPTPKGQAFDRAVDQMRSTLTALTRVPGVGAMSDFETKLDQAKFPARTDYENVTQQQIDGIATLLRTIEEGYNGLLSGGTGVNATPDQEPDLSQMSDEDLLRALSGG